MQKMHTMYVKAEVSRLHAHMRWVTPSFFLSGSSIDFAWLLTQVMRDAADGQVVSWMRTLEEESGIVPLWEVMFQLMCHPVPQVSCLFIKKSPKYRSSVSSYMGSLLR